MTQMNEVLFLSNDEIDRVLHLLGFNLEGGKFRVLRAILTSVNEDKPSITYNELAARIEESEGKQITRQLAYRYIKGLEAEGFIDVDRSRYRRQYRASYDMIIHAIEKKRDLILEDLHQKQKNFTKELEVVEDINTTSLARRTREILAGRKFPERTRAVEGFVDVQKLIDDVIYNRAEDGDVIRLTLDWVGFDVLSRKRREVITERIGDRDVKFKILFHKTPDDRVLKFFKEGLLHASESKWNVDIRFCPRDERTYEIAALNRYGIVLIMSLAPLTALWVPHTENELLTNDAIDSFDREFEEGKTIQEVLS